MTESAPPAPAPRKVVIDVQGEVISDTPREPRDAPLSLDSVAEILEDGADLARRGKRLGQKLGRVGRFLSEIVGPLDRPIGAVGPDKTSSGKP